MVINAAVQMLREAEELKETISKFKSGTSMLQDRNLWILQQQLQKIYQKVLIIDLDYALDKKVEQDLWNIGFKQQIDALQSISKERKNPLRSDGQAMLSWVLQAAAGFYLCLLHQICTTFKLDLPFRRRASLLGWSEGWGGGGGGGEVSGRGSIEGARYITQHCLVHLGDLARYRHQLHAAHAFYRQAVDVGAHSGQPYNQLALVWWLRGRRLAALYWHVRALRVRAPFPPAANNLRRTLAAAAAAATASAAAHSSAPLPVLGGMSAGRGGAGGGAAVAPPPARLDARAHVDVLLRAAHLIYNLEDLDTSEKLVESLNSSLMSLIVTDSFEPMTLIKMCVVCIWLVEHGTEQLRLERAQLAASEARGAEQARALAGGALLAMLLPAYTRRCLPARAMPALHVWLQWSSVHARALRPAPPALLPALAHALTRLAAPPAHDDAALTPADTAAPAPAPADTPANSDDIAHLERIPLMEDIELLGFAPLEPIHASLRFVEITSAADPSAMTPNEQRSPLEMGRTSLENNPELEQKVRARRMIELGKKIAQLHPDILTFTEENGVTRFECVSGSAALEECAAAVQAQAQGAGEGGGEPVSDSDGEGGTPPPPKVISEADFKEKVREKRAGILKPQGSLERAREERALAGSSAAAVVPAQADVDPPPEEETATQSSNGESQAEAGASAGAEAEREGVGRKTRMNVAMAAIMRKQEETNKQVKFLSPPPTPDSVTESAPPTPVKDDKPRIIQPKPIKSLTNIPVGKKTGGILSLKDKSAGYPHLVNVQPEPPKKEEETQPKQNSQQTPPKHMEQSPNPTWQHKQPHPTAYTEPPRMNFQHKNAYPPLNYNPNYQGANNQGIRLAVVNPKEIDVRTAALQKQNARSDVMGDAAKYGPNFPMSGDKKNFLNDLPPRFANQYRYWQTAQENQSNAQDNKFRDDNFRAGTNLNMQQRPNWPLNPPQMQENYQQAIPWWKPDSSQNYPNFSPATIQPNFYAHLTPNPYQTMPTFTPNTQNKPEGFAHNFGQSSMQPMPQIQNYSTPSYNPLMTNFGSYQQPVTFDSSLYPQFSKSGFLGQVKVDKPPGYGVEGEGQVYGAGAIGDAHRTQMNAGYEAGNDAGGSGGRESTRLGGENSYSLFSGAPPPSGWGQPRDVTNIHAQQSLWSNPGQSPLERLLEQQKQMKPPPPTTEPK